MWSLFNISEDPDTTGEKTHSAKWTGENGAMFDFSQRCPETEAGLTMFQAAANVALEKYLEAKAQQELVATKVLQNLNDPKAGES